MTILAFIRLRVKLGDFSRMAVATSGARDEIPRAPDAATALISREQSRFSEQMVFNRPSLGGAGQVALVSTAQFVGVAVGCFIFASP